MSKVSIKNLTEYGSRGWQWTVESNDTLSGETEGTDYRTNGAGDGLWVVGALEDEQVSGTCQFSLPSKKNAARSKLYREFPGEQD